MKNKYISIPLELRQYKNWVCYQAVPDERSHSGISKKPINPYTGGFAQSNNPTTWADFETSVKEAPKYSGIGFMFSNTPFFGVDLDDMPNDIEDFKNGGCNNIVAEFVNTLQSYSEMSQSGTGVHIICKGKLPKGGRKKKHDFGGFEMYETGRFFVMTGNYCSEYAEITDCTEKIKALHEKYIGGGREPQGRVNPPVVNLSTASDIVRTASNAKNGNNFQALYSGNTNGYGSHSEADMALCNMLAFWTGCDADKMDAIFRQSGLMRDKWDRKQAGSTYGAITIQKAIAGCSNVYNPNDYQKQTNNYSLNIGNSTSTDSTAVSVPQQSTTEQSRLYTLDDMGNAKRFVDLFGNAVRFSYTDRKWLYYDGRKWCIDNTGAVHRMADRT